MLRMETENETLFLHAAVRAFRTGGSLTALNFFVSIFWIFSWPDKKETSCLPSAITPTALILHTPFTQSRPQLSQPLNQVPTELYLQQLKHNRLLLCARISSSEKTPKQEDKTAY